MGLMFHVGLAIEEYVGSLTGEFTLCDLMRRVELLNTAVVRGERGGGGGERGEGEREREREREREEREREECQYAYT